MGLSAVFYFKHKHKVDVYIYNKIFFLDDCIKFYFMPVHIQFKFFKYITNTHVVIIRVSKKFGVKLNVELHRLVSQKHIVPSSSPWL